MPAQEAKEWGWARWNDSHALCPPRMADEEDPTSLGDPQVGTKENTAKSPGSRKHTWLSVRMWVLLPSVITEMTERVADSSSPISLPFHKIPWTRHRT